MKANAPTLSPADAAAQLAPIRNLEGIQNGDHFVQFYENDQFLIQSVGAYVAQGFVEGNAAILILTAPHRVALEKRLMEGGVNAAEYQRAGLYYAFDAADMLSRFMVGGHPNPKRFRAVFEPVIEVAALRGTRVRAFGEMVALLWGEGNKAAAIELEMLWNDLMENNGFCLLCAYPVSCFSEEDYGRGLRHVCRAHNRVFPAETNKALTA